MTEHQVEVKTHQGYRKGVPTSRARVATRDTDGRLFVRHNGRWWTISSRTIPGTDLHSINVGYEETSEVAQRLNARSQS